MERLRFLKIQMISEFPFKALFKFTLVIFIKTMYILLLHIPSPTHTYLINYADAISTCSSLSMLLYAIYNSSFEYGNPVYHCSWRHLKFPVQYNVTIDKMVEGTKIGKQKAGEYSDYCCRVVYCAELTTLL